MIQIVLWWCHLEYPQNISITQHKTAVLLKGRQLFGTNRHKTSAVLLKGRQLFGTNRRNPSDQSHKIVGLSSYEHRYSYETQFAGLTYKKSPFPPRKKKLPICTTIAILLISCVFFEPPPNFLTPLLWNWPYELTPTLLQGHIVDIWPCFIIMKVIRISLFTAIMWTDPLFCQSKLANSYNRKMF